MSPVTIAVGGGKGGVGKSVFSVLLAQWFARLGKSTVLADLDLGGANLHTLLGIKEPPLTLLDYLSRRVGSLGSLALDTEVENLRVVCGSGEVLSVANPQYSQKMKLIRGLKEIDADFVVVDLGAGTSLDVLDFLLASDEMIIVTTAEPISVYNAYGLLRNLVFRCLLRLCRGFSLVEAAIREAMDPHNEKGINTVRDLYRRLFVEADMELMAQVSEQMMSLRPGVVVNQVHFEKERNAAKVIQQVAERYLALEIRDLGSVPYDSQLQMMVARMTPLTSGNQHRGAFEAVHSIAARFVYGDGRLIALGARRDSRLSSSTAQSRG